MPEPVTGAAALTPLTAAIPSPSWSGFEIGPFTIHAYALCILAGIVAALMLAQYRWKRRGGSEDDLWNIAVWAIPAGIIGGRLYYVLTVPGPYFGPNGNPLDAFKIWQGGLGIGGAVALGALTVFLVCRHYGIRFTSFIDAAAPGLILAQAFGRWGNWFNQELFGRPTTLPWGLQIDKVLNGAPNPNWPDAALPADTLFHPTFLYESLWNFVGCLLLIWSAKRFRFGHGQVFYAYICYYTIGRLWIESLRIDHSEYFLGVRINMWFYIFVLFIGLALFTFSRMRHREPAPEVYTERGLARMAAARADSTDAGAGEHHRGDDHRGGGSGTGGSTASGTAGGTRAADTAGHGDHRSDDEGGNPLTDRSFGFFGAVTSAISIVPQVRRRPHEDGSTSTD
ncbi:prolipoprotein diacylglyceryl transferase [Brevibacterium sp. p3-SID960]|uniref:prolipoprotein diacylglyceryl transferase n=1 Tax=Brevibacterium sp. p3-SID960 TaxID=2916063 RepID=UPI0021A71CA9|nr:prolipoprotein diacylglyceryl transferase [Brevibacterium sp. p3-SID960]MCT1690250.1 prolipoprotein diacylglyceryl transferase [Brevibacterium sp. p3-SID960]